MKNLKVNKIRVVVGGTKCQCLDYAPPSLLDKTLDFIDELNNNIFSIYRILKPDAPDIPKRKVIPPSKLVRWQDELPARNICITKCCDELGHQQYIYGNQEGKDCPI